ncbi:Polysaccharide biosynthesis protein [Stieleria maiorica]|uniref:Polysaccharide biosynthesis protein n=1 Tax=Stieleria maiorica TaxID=2795974 RepID=A0A5B9MCI4_9BACT|nr:oligosaccharide flippase family protein [Stieleria maiorica]QEF98728.1 Polysaccharide biosynthesis protein [Stieleria maiorica]
MKDLGVLFSEKTLSIALGFCTTFVAYRLLSPAGYGAVGVLEALFAVSTSLVAFRTTESLTRCLIEFRKHELAVSSLVKVSLSIDLATRCVSVAMVAIAASLAEDYFARLNVTYDLVLLLGVGNLMAFPQDTYTSLIREQRAFRYMATASLSSKVVLLFGLCVLFGLNISTLWSYIAVVLVSRLFQLGFIVHFIRRYQSRPSEITTLIRDGLRAFANPFRFWHDARYADYWYFLKMGFFTSTLSGLVKNGSDMLLIGHFGTATDVGHYKLAKSLAEKIQIAPSLLAPYFFQDFSEWVVEGRYDRLRSFLKRVVSLWSPTVAAACLLAFLVCQPVIVTFFGNDSLAAVYHFRILLAGMFVQIALFWVQPLVLSLKLLKAQLLGVLFVATGYFLIVLLFQPIVGVYSISSALAFAWGGGYLYLLVALQRQRSLLHCA